MKLRIYKDQIRLRLSVSEVEQFGNNGQCSASISFPNGTALTYKLVEGTDNMISYARDVITVVLCEEIVETWIKTDQVGIKADLPMDNGSTIGILVEKDFQCLTNLEEDKSDLFPNPKDSH